MKTIEQRQKISDGLKKSWQQGKYNNRITKGWPGNNKGKSTSLEIKQKISKTLTGRKLTKEHSNNIKNALISDYKNGNRSPMMLNKLGELHPNWKGDDVIENTIYGRKHNWIKRQLGTPSVCENCGITNAKKFDWANLSGEYILDINDWARLCRSCHWRFDNSDLIIERNFSL